MISILEQLDKPEFRPSKSDRAFMEYIRANAHAVPHTAIARLAAAAGVSESTITRFAKKMGYDSLQAFKVALAEELTEGTNRYIINRNIQAAESARDTGRKLLDANIGTLEKSLQLLPDGLIERCADWIREAPRLRFIGLGNSGFVARDAAYKFYRIGMDSMGLDNSHEMIIMASLVRPDDVILAVSHSGNSNEVRQTQGLAKKNGAKVILVTANRQAAMKAYADECVIYEAKESLLETGSITVKIAQFFLLDLIYTQVVKVMSDRAIENKQKTAQALSLLYDKD